MAEEKIKKTELKEKEVRAESKPKAEHKAETKPVESRDETVLQAVEAAKATGKIKKGANEVTKMVERGTAKMVVIAKDVNPPEVTMHIPMIAKEKNIPCFEVASREELGAAAGLAVGTAAVAIVEPGNAKDIIKELTK